MKARTVAVAAAVGYTAFVVRNVVLYNSPRMRRLRREMDESFYATMAALDEALAR